MSWCKFQIHAVGGPSDLLWVYIGYQARKGLHTETVKIKNSHVTVIYLRIIKNTYFYVVKQQNRK